MRTPVIPGFNDTQDVLTAIAELVRPFPQVRYEPLPYHRLGTQKYTFIGKTCPMGDVRLDNEFFKQALHKMHDILGERLIQPKGKSI